MFKRDLYQKKGNIYSLVILLVIVLMLMTALYECSHRGEPHPFAARFVPGTGDTVNVAIELNPAVYRVTGDSVSGRDYELLRRISERHGVPMKFFPFVPLSRAVSGLESGEFDMVVASLPLTTELKERFLMTDPVYLDREILVQRHDSTHTPIKSQVQLGGDTVWITEGSPFRSRLENLSAEIGDTICIMSHPDYSAEALFILTARGVIKYAVINEGIARQLEPEFDNVDISTPISFTQFQSWALARGDSALCDSLNRWIASVAERSPGGASKK